MLMDILMEALMSMDDESLDYVLESCDAEELEIIGSVMEAAEMSAKDKEDFNTIERIQRKARSGGWGSVPKTDRDEFVKIMSNTDNLKVLKKAKSLGEREASHDDKVKGALRSLGLTAGGAAIGAGVGGTFGTIKGQNDAISQLRSDIKGHNSLISKINTQNIDNVNKYNIEKNKVIQKISDNQDKITDKIKSIRDNNDYVNMGLDYIDKEHRADKGYINNYGLVMNPMMDDMKETNTLVNNISTINKNINSRLKSIPDSTVINVPNMGEFSPTEIKELIKQSAQSGAAKGAGVGALTGAGLSAILAAVKKAKRYNKDTRDVLAQGDAMHPDKQWKQNRKYK